jgi:type II secretory pathway predicted ATPase ExeA/septal ring-binding cell division protein DamX
MFPKQKIKPNFYQGRSETNEYFRYFGFHQDPFDSNEKENSLYLLPGWDQQIDLLVHYLSEENTLLILSGPKGVGKTTLINFFLLEAIHGFSPTETAVESGLSSGEFLIQLGDNIRTCQVIADNALMPEQILEVVSGAFDISMEGFFGSCKEQSDGLIDALQHCKQSCILLIDDAQELPDTSLELLLYMISLQSDAQHRLHVILIGDAELKKRLAKMAKTKHYDGLTHAVDLLPLTPSQTEYYLQHRFTSAGLSGEMPLSNSTKNKIYKLSGGVPGILNQLARQSLIEAVKKANGSSAATFLNSYKATLVGGAFLLASFAIILAYLGQNNTAPKKTPDSKQVAYHPVIVRKEQPELINSTGFSGASQAVLSVGRSIPVVPVTQVPKIQTQPQAGPEIPLQNRVQVEPNTSLQVQTQPQSPQIFIPPKAPTLIETNSLIDPDSMVSSENSDLIVPLKAVKKSQAMFLKNNLDTKVATSNSKPQKNGKIQSETTSPKNEKPLNYSKRLIHANAAHYTLRLTDMPSEISVKAFVAKNKLGGNVMYYSDKNSGKYVVVYGEYADLETAKRAIQLLPKPLRSFSAQPAEFSVIQQAIHQED